MSLTKEELKLLLEKVAEAYEKAGKKIQTAVLYSEDEEEVLIDNRKDEEIN
jgi:hypothetical protein